MSRPDPIEYAERLYAAIRAANFSPISFLAFGNAVKEGVAMRSMPRIAVEPFMRVVGEMLDLEEEIADGDVLEADVTTALDAAAVAMTAPARADSKPEPRPAPTDADASPEGAPSESTANGSERPSDSRSR